MEKSVRLTIFPHAIMTAEDLLMVPQHRSHGDRHSMDIRITLLQANLRSWLLLRPPIPPKIIAGSSIIHYCIHIVILSLVDQNSRTANSHSCRTFQLHYQQIKMTSLLQPHALPSVIFKCPSSKDSSSRVEIFKNLT